jgi:hypothetical protein
MKKGLLALLLGALALTATSAALARVDVSVGIAPFGYGYAPPPVVYEPDYGYAAPPVVYFGGGYWGGDHDRRHEHRRHH